ncbi:MAG: Rne/Rng family ribonuclease [Deltaproteobacteria bacterium]|nr:Rne/Rng family ribonuclease [Deltaproteobacteria bacterium]
MKNVILATYTAEVTRVAAVEDGRTVEILVERSDNRTVVGNIYKGRVVRVLPGINSAFVDVGLSRTAFLHALEAVPARAEPEETLHEEGSADEGEPAEGHETEAAGVRIEDHVRENQEILVQVRKEPIGTKGARLTRQVSLPGRLAVLLPLGSKVGVSKTIEDPVERERLRDMGDRVRPPGMGLILRTAAEGRGEAELAADVHFLLSLWEQVRQAVDHLDAPSLIHEDLGLLQRAARDFITQKYEGFVIDSPAGYKQVLDFVGRFMHGQEHLFHLHTGDQSLFQKFGVEVELAKALDRRVWLPSGGSIVIERTEALTAIDVNTGRFVGRSDMEETILQINLEAAAEIAHQVRLRNVGGIIVIDFIDMLSAAHRDRVFSSLVAALERDKAKIRIAGLSDLGLVEMTRKRTRESLLAALTETCYCCHGKGYLRSPETICHRLMESVRDKISAPSLRRLHVHANPRVVDTLLQIYGGLMEELERRTGREVVLTARTELHMERFEVFGETA